MKHLLTLIVMFTLVAVANGITSPLDSENSGNRTTAREDESEDIPKGSKAKPSSSDSEGAKSEDLFGAMLEIEKLLAEEKAKLLSPGGSTLAFVNPQLLQMFGFSEAQGRCLTDLTSILLAAKKREKWSLELLDSIGKSGSGLLRGNVLFIGDYEECMDVNTHLDFETHFCRTTFYIMKIFNITLATPTGFVIGICIPDSCNEKVITDLINYYVSTRSEVTGGVFGTTCNERDRDLSSKAVVVIVLCSIFATILIVATAYDLFLKLMIYMTPEPRSLSGLEETVPNGGTLSGSRKPFSERAPIIDPDLHKGTMYLDNPGAPKQKSGRLDIFKQVLLSFSLTTNASSLLSNDRPANSITCIDGLRVISMIMVISFHFFNNVGLPVLNWRPFLDQSYDRWTFMIIPNGQVSVDTFFAISGILLAYLTLKELVKTPVTPRFFGSFYLNRLWRLTPTYWLIMMTYVPLFKYVYDGPMWLQEGFEKKECEDTWWTNLLYINNFVRDEKQCMPWTWYLANDMQFYLISPLIFLPMFFYEWRGVLVALAFLVANAICGGVITDANDLPAVQLLEDLEPGAVDNYFSVYYIKPYTRIGPFVVGMITGFLLYKTQLEARMPKMVVVLGWMAAGAIALSVIYGPTEHMKEDPYSTSVAALYAALSRIAWGVSISWIVFACANGYGGFINSFLSWKGFVTFSKMTYCAYLVHPIVVLFFFTSQRTPLYLTSVSVTFPIIGIIIIAYAIAFAVTIAYEIPMTRLAKVFKAYRKSQSQK